MQIELRQIKIAERQSRETTAFSANIFVEGYNVGTAFNDGGGGCTLLEWKYQDDKAKQLFKDAEAFCLTLPPEELDGFSMPMNFVNRIDQLIDEHYGKMQDDKAERIFNKTMATSIMIGKPGDFYHYRYSKFKMLISDMIGNKQLEDNLAKIIAETRAKLREGEDILNTNIPAHVLNQQVN